MDKLKKDIDAACYEIASNVRNYEHGGSDYEHYVATFEGERNYIVGMFDEMFDEIRGLLKEHATFPDQWDTDQRFEDWSNDVDAGKITPVPHSEYKEIPPHSHSMGDFRDGKGIICNEPKCGFYNPE